MPLRRIALTLSVALVLALVIAFAVQRPDRGQLHLVGDDRYYLIQAASLLLDGDLDFSNEYAAFGDPFNNARYEATRGLGNALMWAPFLYLGWASGAMVGAGELSQLGPWLTFGCAAGTLLYALVAFFLIFGDPRLSAVPRVARSITLAAFAFGTPVLPYTLQLPLYNHVLCLFLAVVVFRLADSTLEHRRLVALGGVATGLLLCVRPELAVLVLLFCAEPTAAPPVSTQPAWRRRFIPIALVGAAFFAAELVIFAIAGKSLVSEGFLELAKPHLGAPLFGPRNGFFHQQPLLLIGTVALVVWAARSRQGRILLLCIAVIVWVQASAWDVWGGGSIGARRLVPIVPFAAFGLLALSARMPTAAITAAIAVLTGAYAAATRGLDRAIAIERNERAQESDLTAWIGKATAMPWLIGVSLRDGVSLDQAYRVCSYVVLYRWPTQTGRITDQVPRGTQRFSDFEVEAITEPDSQRRRFVLPVHRTRPDAVLVRLAVDSPVLASWNGTVLKPVAAAPGLHAFALPPTEAPGTASLALMLQPDAVIEEIAVVADVATPP